MSRKVNRSASTPAIAALEALGIEHEPLPYEHDPRSEAYGEEAARALGLPPEQVFKTLLLRVDERRFGVVCVPVSTTVDLKAAAGALGGKKAALAAPADVRRLTGYVVGGVSPLGGRTPLETVVDDSALAHERVYVSGGRRGLDVGLAPADLLRATEGTSHPVAR